jgi:hypothetical protein
MTAKADRREGREEHFLLLFLYALCVLCGEAVFEQAGGISVPGDKG